MEIALPARTGERWWRVILLVLMLGCPPAFSQELIGIGIGGDVGKIDPQTGAYFPIGSTGVSYGNWTALAKNRQGKYYSANGYWNLPYRIFEIDPYTGSATFIVQTSLFGINALAFDSSDTLYAANDRTTPSPPHPYDLYEIDLLTGAATLIGDMGVTVLTSLTSNNGEILGYVANIGLVRVNVATGLATDVNQAFRGPLDLSESLCFGDPGQLFQVDAGLWIMDPVTGVPCFVGLTGYAGFIVGIEYLSGPASPFTLGTLGETGGPMGIELWGASPLSTVVLLRARGGGGPTPVAPGYPCAGTLLDLNASLQLATILRTDSQGHARLGPAYVPPGMAGSLRLQALDMGTCRTSNLARVIY